MSQTNHYPARLPGLILVACGVASVALLLFHPEVNAASFVELLRAEAAERTSDAAVHGGFIVVLGIELACLSVIVSKLERPSAVAGLAFFTLGVVALAGSMVTDGLVLPAVAAKYADAPAKAEYARSLFVLGTSYVRVLMPIGLTFQGAGIAMWGVATLPLSRAAGVLSLICGLVLAAAGAAGTLTAAALMAAILLLAAWTFLFGATLAMRKH